MQEVEDEIAKPRALLVACLLLFVGEAPAHGYELIGRLQDFGFSWNGPGPIYHQLHSLAKVGLLDSTVEHPHGGGPARRVYSLTDKGRIALAGCAQGAEELSRVLADFLSRYRGLVGGTTSHSGTARSGRRRRV